MQAKFAKLRSFQPRETMHQREEARIEKSNKALQDHIAGIKTKPGPYNRDVLLDEFERVLSMWCGYRRFSIPVLMFSIVDSLYCFDHWHYSYSTSFVIEFISQLI